MLKFFLDEIKLHNIYMNQISELKFKCHWIDFSSFNRSFWNYRKNWESNRFKSEIFKKNIGKTFFSQFQFFFMEFTSSGNVCEYFTFNHVMCFRIGLTLSEQCCQPKKPKLHSHNHVTCILHFQFSPLSNFVLANFHGSKYLFMITWLFLANIILPLQYYHLKNCIFKVTWRVSYNTHYVQSHGHVTFFDRRQLVFTMLPTFKFNS